MVEVTNELIYKLMLEMQAEQKAMRGDIQTLQAGQEAVRDELANLNDTTRALAKSNVSIRREISELKDRMTILSVAVDEGPHTHA
jgi:predicted  nucleic acid-binding Zn-ribbon protein